MHRRHEDRYCMMFGEIEVIFFDDREGIETRGEVSRVVLSEHPDKYRLPLDTDQIPYRFERKLGW